MILTFSDAAQLELALANLTSIDWDDQEFPPILVEVARRPVPVKRYRAFYSGRLNMEAVLAQLTGMHPDLSSDGFRAFRQVVAEENSGKTLIFGFSTEWVAALRGECEEGTEHSSFTVHLGIRKVTFHPRAKAPRQ